MKYYNFIIVIIQKTKAHNINHINIIKDDILRGKNIESIKKTADGFEGVFKEKYTTFEYNKNGIIYYTFLDNHIEYEYDVNFTYELVKIDK